MRLRSGGRGRGGRAGGGRGDGLNLDLDAEGRPVRFRGRGMGRQRDLLEGLFRAQSDHAQLRGAPLLAGGGCGVGCTSQPDDGVAAFASGP